MNKKQKLNESIKSRTQTHFLINKTLTNSKNDLYQNQRQRNNTYNNDRNKLLNLNINKKMNRIKNEISKHRARNSISLEKAFTTYYKKKSLDFI